MRRRSAPESPRAGLSRLSHLPLGSGEGRLQVGSDLGHNLLGTTDLRLPAAFTAGTTLAGLGSARGPDGNPVPGHLLVHGDAHGHLHSVGDGQTYPIGGTATKFSLAATMRCIAIALVCQGMSRCRWQRSPVRRHPTAVPRSAATQCRQPPENHGSALGVVVVLTISAVGHPDAGEGRRLREQGRRTGGGVLFSSSVGSRSA